MSHPVVVAVLGVSALVLVVSIECAWLWRRGRRPRFEQRWGLSQ